jgi:hypothetical protein
VDQYGQPGCGFSACSDLYNAHFKARETKVAEGEYREALHLTGGNTDEFVATSAPRQCPLVLLLECLVKTKRMKVQTVESDEKWIKKRS